MEDNKVDMTYQKAAAILNNLAAQARGIGFIQEILEVAAKAKQDKEVLGGEISLLKEEKEKVQGEVRSLKSEITSVKTQIEEINRKLRGVKEQLSAFEISQENKVKESYTKIDKVRKDTEKERVELRASLEKERSEQSKKIRGEMALKQTKLAKLGKMVQDREKKLEDLGNTILSEVGRFKTNLSEFELTKGDSHGE